MVFKTIEARIFYIKRIKFVLSSGENDVHNKSFHLPTIEINNNSISSQEICKFIIIFVLSISVGDIVFV